MDVQLRTDKGDIYRPLPTQKLFHASTAKHRCFIAGFGNGKTQCGAIEAALQSLEYPGENGQAVVARYEYKQLERSTWKTLLATLPKAVIKDVTRSDLKITLKNNFEILGWNLKEHGDFSSLNLAWCWIDECNQEGVELEVYKQLRGRLRDNRGSRQSWLTGNPAGKNWVYDLFFASKFEPGKKEYPRHAGFQALPGENTHNPADYLADLRELYDEVWIEKYLEGSFDIFEGMVFDNFDRGVHCVLPFGVPEEWPRFRGLDHGLVNPTACLWLASDFEGNYCIYRCYYQRNAIPGENAANILRLSEGEEIDWTVIDPSTHQQQAAGGTSERIIDQYRMAGLSCEPGNNAVRDSIARIRQLLQPDPSHRFPKWHPKAGEPGSPHLFITGDCAELIWEISQYQWKQIKPGQKDREIPLSKHDHAVDALRYLVMRSPRPAVETLQPTLYDRFMAISAEIKGEAYRDAEEFDLANVIGNEWVRSLR
jgi:hypothetical protein